MDFKENSQKKQNIINYITTIIILCLIATIIIFIVINNNKKGPYEVENAVSASYTKTIEYNYSEVLTETEKIKENKSDMWIAGYNFGIKPSNETLQLSVDNKDYVNNFRRIKENNKSIWENYSIKSEYGIEEFIYYYMIVDKDEEKLRDQVLFALKKHNISINSINKFSLKIPSSMRYTNYGNGEVFDMQGYESSYNAFKIEYEINSNDSLLNSLTFEIIQKKEVEFLKGYNIGNTILEHPNLKIKDTLIIPGYDYAIDYTETTAPVYLYGIQTDGQYDIKFKNLVEQLNETYYENEFDNKETILPNTKFNDENYNKYNLAFFPYIESYMNNNNLQNKDDIIDKEKTLEKENKFKNFIDEAKDELFLLYENQIYSELSEMPNDKTSDEYYMWLDNLQYIYINIDDLDSSIYKDNYSNEEYEEFKSYLEEWMDKKSAFEQYEMFENFDDAKTISIVPCYKQDFLKAFYTGYYSGTKNFKVKKELYYQGRLDYITYSNMILNGVNLNDDINGPRMSRLLDMDLNSSYWYKLGWQEASEVI